MKESDHTSHSFMLCCPVCGNEDRFEEVMYYSVNLLDGNMTYTRSLWHDVDFYRCFECGTEVEPTEVER